jgi:hypothetical protein
MEQNRRKPFRRRWVVAAAVLVVVYVASSGPLQFSQMRVQTATFDDDGHGRWSDGSSADSLGPTLDENSRPMSAEDLRGAQMDIAMIKRADWWPTVYAPLLWMCRHSWGTWLSNYWSLFPVREA